MGALKQRHFVLHGFVLVVSPNADENDNSDQCND